LQATGHGVPFPGIVLFHKFQEYYLVFKSVKSWLEEAIRQLSSISASAPLLSNAGCVCIHETLFSPNFIQSSHEYADMFVSSASCFVD
jgi:hypothetical protein